ncbi:NUDIX domain-containing protein [Nocardia colli]|uniref:NUDIX domain-containing protein n=1 Tax=Nocardia colli TaxID=2545717 RepID=UPI0035DED644
MKLDELVDLVDDSGVVKHPRISRAEVRKRKEELIAQGLYQPIVIVVVLDDDGDVVAHVRGRSKGNDGQGEIDHVCGVISAGETWMQAAHREAAEEIGVELVDLTFVTAGVNCYQRHRTLAVARYSGRPAVVDESEVSRVFIASSHELGALADAGTSFVSGYFEDLTLAMERMMSV